MKKFKFLVKYGLKKRIARKAFVIANIIIFLVLAVIINIPAIIELFGSDEELTQLNIAVVTDEYENLHKDLEKTLNTDLSTKFYFVSKIDSFNEGDFWEDNLYDIALIFKENNIVELYSKESQFDYYIFQTVELEIIRYEIVDYSRLIMDYKEAPDYEDEEAKMLVSSLTTILALPLFMLITLATQFIGVEIIEEKSTKAIETIIASVPAKIHFLSKIVSAVSFVIIQGLLLIIYSFVASLITRLFGLSGINSETGSLLMFVGTIFPNWRLILMITLLFIIFGTLVYLVIAALFASMAVTQEDYQQFQSPLMLVLLAGFYIGIFVPMSGAGNQILKIVSFIPLFSPMVTPIAYASGAISFVQALISLAVVILFFIGLLYVVAPVYRVSILSYDQTKFMKRIKSYFKKGFSK